MLSVGGGQAGRQEQHANANSCQAGTAREGARDRARRRKVKKDKKKDRRRRRERAKVGQFRF